MKMDIQLHNKDCMEVLRNTPSESVDLIVTDPPYQCFDEQTKIKTKRGFIYFKDITKDDEVLSCDLNTCEISYVKIKNIIKRKVSENLIRFRSKGMDLFVTDEHRMIAFREHWKNRTEYNLITSDDGLCYAKNIKKSYYIPRVGYKFKGNDIQYFTLPAIPLKQHSTEYDYSEKQIPIDTWLKFFGFWLADGHVRGSVKNSSKKSRYSIGIKQKRGVNEQFLDDVFNSLPFNFHKHTGSDGKISYEIHNKQLWSYMTQFGNSYEKFIPQWIKDLNTELLSTFYSSYKMGDLTKNGNSTVVSSVSRRLVEDLWEIQLKLGRLTNVNHMGTLYQFNIANDNKMHRCSYPSPIYEYYEGYVYCVELEKYGTLFVDRNGKRAICGNCTPRGSSGTMGGYWKSDIAKQGKIFNNNSISCKEYLPELYRILKDKTILYLMCNNINLQEMINEATKVGFHFVKSLIWEKGNKICGKYYMGCFEYILLLRKGRDKPINNCGTPDILKVPIKKMKDEQGNNLHDTEKPVELMKILIENSSNDGETVFEPFMGIGATGVAAVSSGRNFIGCEIDEKYFKICEQRINEAASNISGNNDAIEDSLWG